MRLIIFGPHGSGKGTQAKLISKHYKIPVIDTGEILRKNIEKNTELGKKVKKYLDENKYVPDEIMNPLVEEMLNKDECKKGFILDGYPRTVEQAKFLDNLLSKLNIELNAVINLQVPDDELVKRLTRRGREEDTKEGIKSRMDEYETKAEPVLDYYRDEGKVVDINGDQIVEKVFKDIRQELDRLVG